MIKANFNARTALIRSPGGCWMRRFFGSRWMKRGLRLSIVVGFLGAGWHAWTVWDRYDAAFDRSIKNAMIYRCAAGWSDETLKPYMNGVGNINVKRLCLTDDDFYVAPYELEAVRNGTMEFKPYERPFDWRETGIVGALWALATVLMSTLVLTVIEVVRWVWGRPRETSDDDDGARP